jgi:hypothetical protein
MPRQKINQVSALAPLVLSLSAFILVLAAVATGWDVGSKDEGSAAHIFQLLIAGQIAHHSRFFSYGRLEPGHARCRNIELTGRRNRIGLCSSRLF